MTFEMKESFADLLDSALGQNPSLEGRVVSGLVIAISGDIAVIDVGFKSEGRVPLKEIVGRDTTIEIRVGDTIDVFVERLEGKNGEVVLSVEKARREAVWRKLELACETGELVNGMIFGKVKGGFAVDLSGAIAFLPGSQVDLRPIKDIRPLVNVMQHFKILKMDKARNNVVVSRRAVLEDTRSEARVQLISRLSEGQIVEGVVKNITDYGAFVDLGGIDGLLHVTDISWKRVNHPSEALKVGDVVNVQVIRFNKDTGRISLGMKQLGEDPWENVTEKFIVGEFYTGKVVNLADYGAFIELENGIEGLIYVTELSWTRKNIHPNQVFSVGDEIRVRVLEVDQEKRRVSLSYKQCLENPWIKFQEDYPVGSIIEGKIHNVTEFGVFVGVNEQLDGMVHLNDISWKVDEDIHTKNYKKGDPLKVKVLAVDVERERISLGIKQLEHDPFESIPLQKGDVLTVKVIHANERGADVTIPSLDNLAGVIKRADFSRTEPRVVAGDVFDAKVMSVDRTARRVNLSVRALESDEMQAAVSALGGQEKDTLGAVLQEAMRSKDLS